MNRRIAIALSVLLIANLFCGGTLPPQNPPPPPQPTPVPDIPFGHNERSVNGSEGTPPDGIPVNCETTVSGNVNIPAGSFSGNTLIQIDCLRLDERADLDQAVQDATGQTGELLGAIKLNPSGMQFNGKVFITVPLLRRVEESEGDSVPIYVFQDDNTTIYEEIQAPIGADCDRWCATITTDHFTTFVAYKFGRSASVSCTDPLGCATYASGEPVRIASLLAFSSENKDASVISYDSEAGILAAIEAYGEIDGHQIEYRYFDEACNPDQAYESAKAIVSDSTFAGVIGTVCSPSAEAAMQIFSSAGYSMVSASNTGAFLTEPNTHPDGYFRVAPPDSFEAEAMAIYAYQVFQVQYVSVVYEKGESSKLLAEIFSAKFIELGGKILGFDEFYDPSLYAELMKVRIAAGETPQAIYMPMPELGGSFANLVTQSEYYGDGVYLLGHSSMMYNNVFLDSSGIGRFLTHFPRSAPNVLYQAPDYGYDAASLMLGAIRSVAQVDSDGTLYVGRQALRDALSAIRNFPGRTGTLSCTPLGDCVTQPLTEVYRYNDSDGYIYQTTIYPSP